MVRSNSFYDLDPNRVFRALDQIGYNPTGKYWQLNSYENRVFDVEVEGDSNLLSRIIIKFYRPGRWSRECIREEHQFLHEIKNEGFFVAEPIAVNKVETVYQQENLYFSIFPKVQGRMVQEFLPEEIKKVGRGLAQIHNIGVQKKFNYRPNWKMPQRGIDSLDLLQDWVAQEVWSRYEVASERIISYLSARLKKVPFIRIHGDCHKGNILHNGQEFYFVDFDDCGMGPAVQDIWMLLDTDEEERENSLELLLAGYNEFRDFDESTLSLCEPLRGLRIINYSAWIAQRWDDPSFPQLFPDYLTYNWWAEEVERLEKIAWDLGV